MCACQWHLRGTPTNTSRSVLKGTAWRQSNLGAKDGLVLVEFLPQEGDCCQYMKTSPRASFHTTNPLMSPACTAPASSEREPLPWQVFRTFVQSIMTEPPSLPAPLGGTGQREGPRDPACHRDPLGTHCGPSCDGRCFPHRGTEGPYLHLPRPLARVAVTQVTTLTSPEDGGCCSGPSPRVSDGTLCSAAPTPNLSRPCVSGSVLERRALHL